MSTRIRAAMISAVFLSLLTLVLVSVWLVVQGRNLRAEAERRVILATNLTAQICRELLLEGSLRLARVADEIARDPGVTRVLIADKRGVIIADSAHRSYGEIPPDIRHSMEDPSGVLVERHPGHWLGISPVRTDENQRIGYAAVEFPTRTLLVAQRRARLTGIMIAVLGILLGAALSFVAATLLTRPLERLLVGIRQLQAGELKEPLRVTGGPEIAEIGNAFNEMAEAVKERVRRLDQLNRMAAALPLARNLQEAAGIIQSTVSSIMGGQSYLWIVEQAKNQLVPISPEGEPVVAGPVPMNCLCLVGQAFTGRRVLTAGRGRTDFPPNAVVTEHLQSESAIVLPLTTSEGTAGVLAITNSYGSPAITSEHEALARALLILTAPIIMSMLRAQSQARAAASLQALLIPETPEDMGIDIYSTYLPAENIAGLGGDYYDFIPLDSTKWAIVVGDASGKGLEAATHTATSKYIVRSYVLEYGTPAEALYWSNRAIALQEQLGNFITLFCIILDTESLTADYSLAGHVPPLIYSAETGKVERLIEGGLPLGIEPDVRFPSARVQLGHGDVLCLYTDGITEARRGDDWFGEARLARLLEENAHRPSVEIGKSIIRSVESHLGGGPQDDIVLVIAKFP